MEYVIGYTIMALNNCCEKASAVFRNKLTQTDIRDMSLAIMCFYVTDLWNSYANFKETIQRICVNFGYLGLVYILVNFVNADSAPIYQQVYF